MGAVWKTGDFERTKASRLEKAAYPPFVAPQPRTRQQTKASREKNREKITELYR